MRKVLKFIFKWNEILTIPFAFLLWWLSPYFLHWIDPTAGTYDAGIFQNILYAIITFLILHGVIWFVVKITWPGIYKFLDDTLEEKILLNGSITQWQKVQLVLFIFSFYFLMIIMCLRSI